MLFSKSTLFFKKCTFWEFFRLSPRRTKCPNALCNLFFIFQFRIFKICDQKAARKPKKFLRGLFCGIPPLITHPFPWNSYKIKWDLIPEKDIPEARKTVRGRYPRTRLQSQRRRGSPGTSEKTGAKPNPESKMDSRKTIGPFWGFLLFPGEPERG